LLKERKENLKREGKKRKEIGLALEGPGLDKSFVERSFVQNCPRMGENLIFELMQLNFNQFR
jgi:hypothetical protein